MKINLSSLLFVFLIYSCVQKNVEDRKVERLDTKIIDSLYLKSHKSLIIPIDSQTDIRTLHLQYLPELKILAWQNKFLNSIDLFSVSDKNFNKRINIIGDNFGFNGKISGFFIYNSDSIYVFDSSRYSLYLSNSQGEILSKSSVEYLQKDTEHPSMPSVYYFRPIMSFGKELFILSNSSGDFLSPTWWTTELILRFNLEDNSYEYELSDSDRFKGKTWGAFFTHNSSVMNGEKIFVSFPMSENLMIYNTISKDTEWVYAGSNKFGSTNSWKKPDLINDQRFYIESNSYREILYDKWRNVYYRFAYKGVEFINEDGLFRDWDDKPCSIIILDEALNKVGETDLPSNHYYTRNAFINEDGLHISNNHPKNSDLNENVLSFTLFKLVSNE